MVKNTRGQRCVQIATGNQLGGYGKYQGCTKKISGILCVFGYISKGFGAN